MTIEEAQIQPGAGRAMTAFDGSLVFLLRGGEISLLLGNPALYPMGPRRIQAEKPNVPVVLMTGFGPQEIARVAGDNNPYRIIWKPFKTESLLRMIDNALENRRVPQHE